MLCRRSETQHCKQYRAKKRKADADDAIAQAQQEWEIANADAAIDRLRSERNLYK